MESAENRFDHFWLRFGCSIIICTENQAKLTISLKWQQNGKLALWKWNLLREGSQFQVCRSWVYQSWMNYALSTRWVRPGINSKLLCWEGKVVGKIRFWIYVQLWWAIHYGRINTMTCYDILQGWHDFVYSIHEQWRSMTSFLGQIWPWSEQKARNLQCVARSFGKLCLEPWVGISLSAIRSMFKSFVYSYVLIHSFFFSCQIMQNSFHNYLHVQYTSILYFIFGMNSSLDGPFGASSCVSLRWATFMHSCDPCWRALQTQRLHPKDPWLSVKMH